MTTPWPALAWFHAAMLTPEVVAASLRTPWVSHGSSSLPWLRRISSVKYHMRFWGAVASPAVPALSD